MFLVQKQHSLIRFADFNQFFFKLISCVGFSHIRADLYTFIYKYKCTLITFQRYLLVLYYYATNDYAAYMQSPSHFAIAYRSLFPVIQHTLT